MSSSINDFKVGEMVRCTNSKSLQPSIGLIISRKLVAGPFSMHVYTILCEGVITTYTSAAVRKLDETSCMN